MRLHVEVVEPFAENSWLLVCDTTGKAALIDPGGHVHELLAHADRLGATVSEIWLTHGHIDHVAGVADALDALDADVPVRLHPLDLPLYEATAQQGAMFGLQVRQPPSPTDWLRAGEHLELGALRASVLHVPGHSPGHVAFWLAAESTLLSGDCLFAGSIGRTDLPGGDHATLMRSIREQLLTLPDEVRVLSGHGPETTIGRERRGNPFLLEI